MVDKVFIVSFVRLPKPFYSVYVKEGKPQLITLPLLRIKYSFQKIGSYSIPSREDEIKVVVVVQWSE